MTETGRISIPALRDTSENAPRESIGGQQLSVRIEAVDLLALVEAVEAARNLVTFAEVDGNPFFGHYSDVLEAALARFDFGDDHA